MARHTSLQSKFRLSRKKIKRLKAKQTYLPQQGKSQRAETKRQLIAQYGSWCMLCNKYMGKKITHHPIIWKCKGGKDDYENGSLLCEECQRRVHKLDWDSKELKEINKKLYDRKKYG